VSGLVFLYSSGKLKWAELVAHSDEVRNIYTHTHGNLLKCHNIYIITTLQKIFVTLHSGMNTEDSSLLAYYVVTDGKYLLIFGVIIVPLSSLSGRCGYSSKIA